MNPDTDVLSRLRMRHLLFGWRSLCVFAVLGAVLETLHGFKVDGYLAVGNETRRLLWRLGHAHGALLSLVHIAFAASLAHVRGALPSLGSACLVGASVALPGGFLLGGFGARGGDPGVGILLTPFGAVLLLVALVSMSRSLRA